MGRRPNQLIADFFERGAKLQDASNRYAHTCRKCGQLFPKGRIDSLFTHLARRCPNLSTEDKQAILSHTQSTAAASSNSSRAKKPLSQPLPSLALPSPDQSVPDLAVSYPFSHDLSALDTLAEVSGRHLDLDTHQIGHTGPRIEDSFEPGAVEQALMLQLRDIATQAPTVSPPQHTQALEPHLGLVEATSEPLAASVHNPVAEAARSRDMDLLLHRPDEGGPTHSTGRPVSATVEPMTWNPVSRRGRPVSDTIASSAGPSQAGFGLLQRQHKARPRGRFTDSRRQEVQEVRKRGACIRCRMLKKPCSDDTPCKTCDTVATARLWKSHCLRTKLADEVGIWSARYWHEKAQIEVSTMQPVGPATDAQAKRRTCTVHLFPNADPIELMVRPYCSPLITVEPHSTRYVWILDEYEAAMAKIEGRLGQLVDLPTSSGGPDFVSATVQHAKVVVEHEQLNDFGNRKASTPSGRSCYNLQSQLLRNTLELYTGTRLLTEPNCITLQLQEEPQATLMDQMSPPLHISERAREDHNGQAIAAATQDVRVVQSQVLAGIQSRCARLAKTIANELERRLLQRQQVSRFATLLSAVVMLISVERLMGFYGAMGQRAGSTAETPAWPLDVPPIALIEQGEQFAELLVMLLRMRSLPPSTMENDDGLLTIDTSTWSASTHVRTEILSEQDEYTQRVASWLQSARLSVSDLQAQRQAKASNIDTSNANADGIRWELSLVSKLLLPWKAGA